MHRRRHDSRQVIATPGGQAALYAAVQARARPGRPCHRRRALLRHLSQHVPRRRRRFHRRRDARPRTDSSRAPTRSAEALEPNTRAILINTPNNPTGAVYSRQRLEEHRRDLPASMTSGCCRDEVYWTLGGGEHVSPRSLPGMAERTLVINSMSKSHGMTGWRMGWLTGPAELITLLDQPQSRHHLRPDRFRLAAPPPRRWKTATASRRSPNAMPARRSRLPRRRARHEQRHRARLRRRHVCHARHPRHRTRLREIRLGSSRRREGRRDAGLELRRGRRRPHPHQPLPARARCCTEAASRLRRFASSYRREAA